MHKLFVIATSLLMAMATGVAWSSAAAMGGDPGRADAGPTQLVQEAAPPGREAPAQRRVYDISLREPDAMLQVLRRLDEVSGQPNPSAEPPRIALVLHGPEIEFFAIANYAAHRELVDLAAKLDAFQIIEVKACETRMNHLGLDRSDMPAFIETVPFGPAEVDRLVEEQGYVRM